MVENKKVVDKMERHVASLENAFKIVRQKRRKIVENNVDFWKNVGLKEKVHSEGNREKTFEEKKKLFEKFETLEIAGKEREIPSKIVKNSPKIVEIEESEQRKRKRMEDSEEQETRSTVHEVENFESGVGKRKKFLENEKHFFARGLTEQIPLPLILGSETGRYNINFHSTNHTLPRLESFVPANRERDALEKNCATQPGASSAPGMDRL